MVCNCKCDLVMFWIWCCCWCCVSVPCIIIWYCSMSLFLYLFIYYIFHRCLYYVRRFFSATYIWHPHSPIASTLRHHCDIFATPLRPPCDTMASSVRHHYDVRMASLWHPCDTIMQRGHTPLIWMEASLHDFSKNWHQCQARHAKEICTKSAWMRRRLRNSFKNDTRIW